MSTSRRLFLKQSSIASAAIFVSPAEFFNKKKNTLIGLQLWTVKEDAAKDFAGTLAHIADVGYTNVELFGYSKRLYFGKTIKETKDFLDQNNLRSTSAHYSLADYLFNKREDELKEVIEDAKTLGHDFVTVPYLAAEHRSMDTFKMLVDKFNHAGEMCKAAGLQFAYHNHNFEFIKTDGTCGYEVLLNGTDKNLVNFEMDLYWVVFAGEKPADWFKKYPGRFPMWHVKDMSASAERQSVEVGTGTIDFKEIFTHKKEAGFKNFFVEQEAFTAPPAEAIKTSIAYIKSNLV